MTLTTALALIWVHFFADFVLQSDRVAQGKSSSNRILLSHVTLYSLPFLWWGWLFALMTAVLHFVTDWCSSRVTRRLWQANQRHWFFVVIGLDQALHLTALFATWHWLQ